jgi:iron complex outermembrane receptor protein
MHKYLTALGLLGLAWDMQAQNQPLEKMSVVGTRVIGRSADEAAVAIEVYDEEQLEKSGIAETGKLLQALSPSFNFSATTVSDGTDSVRPATLKGMGPDQVLILVNGKRQHSQALLNVQQTVGRGSAGTDINAIPVSAIKRVEVLRQGASAQYGSDAIAGVINIVLKDGSTSNQVHVYGARNFEGDGDTAKTGITARSLIGAESFVQVSGEIQRRGETNRAQTDQRFGRKTMRIGESEALDGGAFLNSEFRVNDRTALYLFGGAAQRESESGGFFREPDSDRNNPNFYPNGTLPLLVTRIEDRSVVAGVKRELGEGDVDLSYGYGENSFNFRSKNSMNISLGDASPTETDDGTMKYADASANLDLRQKLINQENWQLDLTTGLVYRQERYQIIAGDPASWTYGPTNDYSLTLLGPTGQLAPAGIQGFPGFQPANEVDATRYSRAAFVDLESRFAKDFLTAVAARYEDYEAVGSSTTGQLSMRYDVNPQLAFRGTVSTGFRVPSLQQVNYSSRSTTFAGSILTETQTARQGSATFEAIGLRDLKNETSINQSIGVFSKPLPRMTISADAYRIRVQDRIVLSEFLNAEPKAGCSADNSNCPIRAVLEPLNVDAAQFFTNAIDTDTRGVDLLVDYLIPLNPGQSVSTRLGYYRNQTQVLDVRAPEGIDPALIFGEGQIVLTEEGQPRDRIQLAAEYNQARWNAGTQLNYYGEVSGAGFGGYKQSYDGKWITDVHSGYNFASGIRLDVGAQNLFNVYPEAMNEDHPVRTYAGGSFKYSWETTPFGFKGGLYYSRLAWNF